MLTQNQISFIRGKVILFLEKAKFKNRRCIGTLKNRVLMLTKSREKHLMRINDSIGFNYQLMKQGGNKFGLICLTLDFEILWSSRNAVLKYGTFLHFSSNGLEPQIFLNLKKFKSSRHDAEIEINELTTAQEPKKTEVNNNLQLSLAF